MMDPLGIAVIAFAIILCGGVMQISSAPLNNALVPL
jgi:hypothetical protein